MPRSGQATRMEPAELKRKLEEGSCGGGDGGIDDDDGWVIGRRKETWY